MDVWFWEYGISEREEAAVDRSNGALLVGGGASFARYASLHLAAPRGARHSGRHRGDTQQPRDVWLIIRCPINWFREELREMETAEQRIMTPPFRSVDETAINWRSFLL